MPRKKWWKTTSEGDLDARNGNIARSKESWFFFAKVVQHFHTLFAVSNLMGLLKYRILDRQLSSPLKQMSCCISK